MDCNSWGETTACIRDIFSHGIEDYMTGLENRSYLKVYPHYTEYKRGTMQRCGPGGKRGKIVDFSHKARIRMLQKFGRIVNYPSVWQDFTFPDDVMAEKTVQERARFSSRCLKQLKRKMEKEFPDLWAIFRREWEPRKSGKLRGQECPHFHCLWDLKGISPQTFKTVCIRLAALWVDVLNTGERMKALSVAVHPNSFRWITNRKMAQNYVSKYVAKLERHGNGESRGRYWMSAGEVPSEEGIEVCITDYEGDFVRRMFRKKIGDKRSGLYRILRSRYFATWLFVEGVTVMRMLEYVKDKLGKEQGRFSPF